MASAFCSPAYALKRHGGEWVAVIPVRGRLSPIIWEGSFESKAAVERWIAGPEGRAAISQTQERFLRRAGEHASRA